MKFGVFDHLDRGGGNLTDQHEDRLQTIELGIRWTSRLLVPQHHRTASIRQLADAAGIARLIPRPRIRCRSSRYGRPS
jgi:hypothetical protein